MSAERWRSVRDAFDRVMSAGENERSSVLDGLPGDLREDVEELIASHLAVQVSGRLDRGIVEISIQETLDAPHEQEFVGSYRVIQKLGEGGMGVVLLAEQARPRRRVAIKVIRPSRVTPKAIQRFQREAEILARLQHPHIAQLIELGEDAGPDGVARHFIAMEFIAGRRLQEYLGEHPRSDVEHIQLLIDMCDGVQHAHANGVIHRDLKPSNVLVTSDGSPKIVDFGVARMVTAESPGMSRDTLTGDIIGTLPYMSPEQLSPKSGNIDTRTDVYALGVVGFEMLTGSHPCASIESSLSTLLGFVDSNGPSNRALHCAALPGELRFVLAKAMASRQSDRYGSAGELADDLRRFLNKDAVSAKPPSFAYQMRVLARKHKPFVAAACAIALVLIAATVVSTHFAITAGTAADKARHEADRAVELRGVLERIFGWTAPDHSADPNISLIAALERVASDIDSVRDPEHRAVLHHLASDAFLSFCVPESTEDQGLYQKATDHAMKAVQIARDAFGSAHTEVAHHLIQLGRCESARSRFAESRASLTEAASILEKAGATLSADFLDDLLILASDEMQQRMFDEAGAHVQKAIDTAAPEPQLSESIRADTLLLQADIINAKGDHNAAEPLYRAALAACNSAPETRPTLKPAIISKLGVVLAKQGKFDEALECQTSALAIRERILPPQHPGLAASYMGLTQMYYQAGRYQEALPYAQSALESYRKAYGDAPHLFVARTQHWIGKILAGMNRHDEAVVRFVAAADMYARISDPDECNIAAARSDRGESLMKLGRYDEAELDLLEAQRILKASTNAEPSRRLLNDQRLSELSARRQGSASNK